MTGEKLTTVLNLSCLYAIVWGLFIAWPYTDTFATQPTLWAPMRQIVQSEAVWGSLFIASGIGAYLLNKWRPWAASFLMFGQFISIAVLFFLGDFGRAGWGLIGVLAVFNFLQGRALWKSRNG